MPLGQATLLTIYPQERHGQAMAIFSTGAMMGPIIGPTMGGWLTDNLNWRWCFYINLPVGAICALGIFLLFRHNRNVRREGFDVFGFAALSIAVGVLQLMLDRGQLKDWFNATEIWVEAIVAGTAFYLFVVHMLTTSKPAFVSPALFKDRNFLTGNLFIFIVGVVLWLVSLIPMDATIKKIITVVGVVLVCLWLIVSVLLPLAGIK